MKATLIIPKRFRTFARCIEELLARPERKAFQSELKRLVYSKSWRKVVKREIALWNDLIQEEFPGQCLVTARPMKNPKTGKSNEILMEIHPDVEVVNKPTHFLLSIKMR